MPVLALKNVDPGNPLLIQISPKPISKPKTINRF